MIVESRDLLLPLVFCSTGSANKDATLSPSKPLSKSVSRTIEVAQAHAAARIRVTFMQARNCHFLEQLCVYVCVYHPHFVRLDNCR